jgi:Putative auto-transporter adhesin, head GIN domain
MNSFDSAHATPWIKFFPPFLMLAAVLSITPPASAATTGSGKMASETRNVSDFDAISLSGSMTLDVRQTGKESLTISAEDNILPLIETTVESSSSGRTLRIRVKPGESFRSYRDIKIAVEVARLVAVSTSGSGNINVDSLKSPALKVNISGSGNARLKGLAIDGMEVSIAGSGDVRGEGNTKQLKLSIAGSGDARLAELVADEVKVSIAGSGDAKVHANKSLSATIAGSGDIQYRGSVEAVKSTVMGAGSVTRMK